MASFGTLLLTAAFAFSIAPTGSVSAQETYALLTADEIAEWATATDDTRGINLTRSDGPTLKVNAPTGFALASPVSFDIEIVARDGVAPELDSLRIEYGIGPIWTDVTNRIRQNARMVGSHFQATGAELPAGKHRLRLSIKDADGRLTSADIQFTVSE